MAKGQQRSCKCYGERVEEDTQKIEKQYVYLSKSELMMLIEKAYIRGYEERGVLNEV
jgi:hypothetical protein